jgi:hypothetical protein
MAAGGNDVYVEQLQPKCAAQVGRQLLHRPEWWCVGVTLHAGIRNSNACMTAAAAAIASAATAAATTAAALCSSTALAAATTVAGTALLLLLWVRLCFGVAPLLLLLLPGL